MFLFSYPSVRGSSQRVASRWREQREVHATWYPFFFFFSLLLLLLLLFFFFFPFSPVALRRPIWDRVGEWVGGPFANFELSGCQLLISAALHSSTAFVITRCFNTSALLYFESMGLLNRVDQTSRLRILHSVSFFGPQVANWPICVSVFDCITKSFFNF